MPAATTTLARRRSQKPSWYERTETDEPERALLVAVIQLAIRDALSGWPRREKAARAYLHGPNFRADCELLGISAERILAEIGRQENLMDRMFTDDEIRTIYHTEYRREKITLDDLARRYNTSGVTLSRAFARLNLPRRKRGGWNDPDPTPAGGAKGGPDNLRDLNQLLTTLGTTGLPGRVTVRVQIAIDIDPENQ